MYGSTVTTKANYFRLVIRFVLNVSIVLVSGSVSTTNAPRECLPGIWYSNVLSDLGDSRGDVAVGSCPRVVVPLPKGGRKRTA